MWNAGGWLRGGRNPGSGGGLWLLFPRGDVQALGNRIREVLKVPTPLRDLG